MTQVIKWLLDGLLQITTGIVDAGSDYLGDLIDKPPKTKHDASFHKDPGSLVSEKNAGFTVNGLLNLSVNNSYKNLICYGGSGAGKTTNIIIPNLLHHIGHNSFIINDPSSEIRLAVSGVMHKHDVTVLIFDPSKPHISLKFNPLSRVKMTSEKITKLAQLLILNTLGNKSSDPFWQLSAVNILTIILRFLIHHADKKYMTLRNALYLLDTLSTGSKVDILISRTGDEELIASYKSFLANDPKVQASVLATAKAALSLFGTDTIAQVTSDDTIDFSDFRNGSVCLFLNNNISNAKFYAPLTAVLLQQFFDFLMEDLPKPKEKPVFIVIDEASSIYFNSLPITISNIRKYNAGINLIYQSYHQMVTQYSAGEARSIESNCYTRVYLPGVPIDIATDLSKELGSFEHTDDKNVKHTRSLMTNSEIKEHTGALVFCGANRCLNLPLRPVYRTHLKKLTEIPPYVPPVNDTSIPPPLIPLPDEP